VAGEVAAGSASRSLSAPSSAASAFCRHLGLGLHHSFDGERQHVAHHVGAGALLQQFEKGHPFVGHRWCRVRSQVSQSEPAEDRQ
jgi:hypothetical protein